MATQATTPDIGELPDGKGLRVAIVLAQWHTDIVSKLERGAIDGLKECGVTEEDIIIATAPGSYELPVVAGVLARSGNVDAVIALGVVIRGETAHFEYVSSPVAHGLQQIAIDTGIPCMFGVLTTENVEQAEARAGGAHGNKGRESAIGAIQTCRTLQRFRSS